MKKIIVAFIIIIAIVSFIVLPSYAEEVTLPEETTLQEVAEPTETPVEPSTINEEGEVVDIIDRIVEAWENGDITLVINLAIDAAVIIFVALVKKTGNKNALEIATKSREMTAGFNNVVDAANDIIKSIDGEGGLKSLLGEETENLKKAVQEGMQALQELDKEKLLQYGAQLKSCMATQKLLAEMLQTVYANSTTIPMPVKNVINEKYVEILHELKGESGDNNA